MATLFFTQPVHAGEIVLSWDDFKTAKAAMSLDIVYYNDANFYYVYAPWSGGNFSAKLSTDTSDSTDFVDNFISAANPKEFISVQNDADWVVAISTGYIINISTDPANPTLIFGSDSKRKSNVNYCNETNVKFFLDFDVFKSYPIQCCQ